jgi:hypothetical protein
MAENLGVKYLGVVDNGGSMGCIPNSNLTVSLPFGYHFITLKNGGESLTYRSSLCLFPSFHMGR